MKVLEDSMNGFMRQNADQMRALTDTVAKSVEARTGSSQMILSPTPLEQLLDPFRKHQVQRKGK